MADEKRIRSLEDLLAEEGLLPLARAVDLVGQIAAVIDVAAANGWVIDRLEPHTIQVTAETPHGAGASPARTKVVGLIGGADLPVRPGGPRASYLPPEVAAGVDPEAARTPAAHQFSLAAIAYEMLAGCPAFPEEIGENREVDRAFAAIRLSPPSVSEMVMGAATGLDAIFDRALSADPARRFAHIDDFVSALREISDPGSVWDDGATVIWSPAAGDMEPPPLSPRITPPAIRRVSAVHAAVRTQSARLADAARQVKSSAGAWAERRRERRRLAQMRQVEPNPPPRPSVNSSVSDSGSLPPPLALASFPAPAIPSRRTQVSFLAAAVMLVLGAVVVMSGSRVRAPVDANSAESVPSGPTVVPVIPESIRPRARAEMLRPSAARTQPATTTTAPADPPAPPATIPPTSQRRVTAKGSAVTAAASSARQTPAKASRRHSRHGGARVASNSRR